MDNKRRRLAEEKFKIKFDESSISKYFEFIQRDWESDHGRKVQIRCRGCNTLFWTWNVYEVFKGKLSKVSCPECGMTSEGDFVWIRSELCDKAMEFYASGHSVSETAEKFGVTKCQINNAVKLRGITNGRQWGEYNPKHNEKQRKMAIENLVEKLESEGFDYVGGYVNRFEKITVKCKTCGEIFERTPDHIKRGNLICRKCEHEKALIRQAAQREERRAEAKRMSEERKKKREAEKIKKNPLGLSDYQLSRRKTLDEVSVCKMCGKKYTLREYMESTGAKYYRNSGYCSAECRDAHTKESAKISHRGRRDSHRHRARKYGCEYDSSVTLKKLIKRDGLKCAICGEMCDIKDNRWSKYLGPMSPTIDHIIPMAKGGGHTWENVQIAHAICNTYKSDNIAKKSNFTA